MRLIERIRTFWRELRRRKVVRAICGYLVVSFVALQVVDATFDLVFNDPAAAGRVVLIGLIAFFPVAVVLSWMFDIRPLSFEHETRDPGPVVDSSTEGEVSYSRIAVLPLANLSEERDNLYFSEGMTEDIAASLGQIEGVRVVGRGVMNRFRDTEPDVGRIAAEVGASTLVMGSVRRDERRLRVTVGVVDRNGTQLWANSFDRELEDVFEVQSELAQRVADAIERRLSPAARRHIESRGTSNPKAYDLYLQGRWLWNRRTEATTSEALRLLGQSVEEDPDFALAFAAIAEARTVLAIYGAEAPAVALRGARQAVDRALSLDPTLGVAVAARACLSAIYDWDWAAAEEGYKQALLDAPSYATAHQWYAMNLLTPLARFDEARAELMRAAGLDPASVPIRVSLGIIDFYARDYERALDATTEVVEESPSFALAHLFVGRSLIQLGRPDEGVSALRRASEHSQASSESLASLGYGLALAGQEGEALRMLHRLEERGEVRYVSKALVAQVLIGLGRHDEALVQLNQALNDRATDLIWLRTRPVYDVLRDRAEFASILSAVGLG